MRLQECGCAHVTICEASENSRIAHKNRIAILEYFWYKVQFITINLFHSEEGLGGNDVFLKAKRPFSSGIK